MHNIKSKQDEIINEVIAQAVELYGDSEVDDLKNISFPDSFYELLDHEQNYIIRNSSWFEKVLDT